MVDKYNYYNILKAISFFVPTSGIKYGKVSTRRIFWRYKNNIVVNTRHWSVGVLYKFVDVQN